MHKEEVSELFKVLSHPSRVKIVKMLYHNEKLSFQDLTGRMNNENLTEHLEVLVKANLIKKENDNYSCNRNLVDDLMSFISKKCGCC